MKAIVIGATGLTGSLLTQKLLADPDYSEVITLVRQPTALQSPKLTQVKVDFTDKKALEKELRGEVLFCCIGTTIGKAGNQERFLEVDYDIPVTCATIAAANQVGKMVLISSIGANARSGNFYLKTKGRVEEVLCQLPFQVLHIFQPGLLIGQRQEKRFAEKLFIAISPVFNLLLWGAMAKYRGIDIAELTQAMVQVAKKEVAGVKRYTWSEIKEASQ